MIPELLLLSIGLNETHVGRMIRRQYGEIVDGHRGINPRSQLSGLCPGVLTYTLIVDESEGEYTQYVRKGDPMIVPDIDGRACLVCCPSIRDRGR